MKNLFSILGGVTLFRAKPSYAFGAEDVILRLGGLAFDYLKEKITQTPLNELKEKAKAGDTEAQYLFGLANYFGAQDESGWMKKFVLNLFASDLVLRETKLDFGEALYWFHKASEPAERGYVLAQFALATMYFKGEGTEQNYSEALRWYEAAAKKGSGEAEYNIGAMYQYGFGVPERPLSALDCYRKAHSPEALYAMGNMYYYGEGDGVISRNKLEAQRCFIEAAKMDYAPAQYIAGVLYRWGTLDEDRYYYDDTQDLSIQVDDFKKTVKQMEGEDEAYNEKLNAIERGYDPDEIEFDLEESENLLKKAAAQNYAPAYYALYKVINSDEKLLLKAAEQGYAPAQVTMAINARNRIGRIDFEEMEKWLRLAAEQGHFGAQYYLGDFHYKGRGGLQKNYELAYKWYYLSSLSGYSHAEERVKELEKKDGFLGLWGNSDISPKQAERLQKEARAMFDEIEKRKKRNRRRNMVFHAAIKKQ